MPDSRCVCQNGLRAAELLARSSFHVILSDVRMPGMDGLSLLRVVRERDLKFRWFSSPVRPDVETAAQVGAVVRACQYLTKPVELSHLTQVVRRAAGLGRLAHLKREAIVALESGKFLAGIALVWRSRLRVPSREIWMAYQPIVDVSRRSLFGYEALLRTTEGSIPHPGAFLDAAEALGKLDELGRAVRAKAPEPLINAPPDAVLFVNLHARDLEDKTLTWPSTPLATSGYSRRARNHRASVTRWVTDLQSKVAELREMGFSHRH